MLCFAALHPLPHALLCSLTSLASCFALQPYIVDAALNYLAASAAQRMGFVELYRYLRAFVDNDDKVT